MEVSKYIVNRLREEGTKHAFVVTGGMITATIDAMGKEEGLEYICTTTEQAGAMAAEAYSRISGNLGVSMATSGPGATNLLTGIGCAYFDSIPTLYITGQVNPSEFTWQGGPRQIGFQETNIVGMASPITKYAKRLEDANEIRYELEKAIHIAKSGRPGPVLLDLPLDVQRTDIDIENLRSYSPEKIKVDYIDLNQRVDQAIGLIKSAERPVVVLGAGIKIGRAEKETRDLVERLGIPVCPSWGAIDILPYNHPLFVEGFGVSVNRAGNFAVQNSDLVISLGSRLDSRQTGGKRETFARGAKKIVLDIDAGELYKGSGINERRGLGVGEGLEIDVPINHSIGDFLEAMYEKRGDVKTLDLSEWRDTIQGWKESYPICPPENFEQQDTVNPYVFVNTLSNLSKEGDIIIPDAGSNLTWTMQGWETKENQRLFSAFGMSPMGYSLPASIGASFANGKGPVTCIIGDGGIKMNLSELETIVNHDLPIKTFVLNNHGYGIITGFQDRLFEGRYKATLPGEGGLGDSDLVEIAKGFGMKTVRIKDHSELKNGIEEVLGHPGPVLCDVEFKWDEQIVPKLEYGRPIEDPAPFIDEDEFLSQMIVSPINR